MMRPSRLPLPTLAAATLVACLLTPLQAGAQLADVRPGDERPELPGYGEPQQPGAVPLLTLPAIPDFEPTDRARGSVLPPVEQLADPSLEALEAGAQVRIHTVDLRGNTVFDEQEIGPVVRPYLAREIGFEELQQLRDDLTLAYVERGYVTSGAIVPPQSLEDGVLEVWMVEGRVTDIQVTTDGRLRESYIESRLARAAGTPVNADTLERALQVLRQDERISGLRARLEPTERRGEALLQVEVVESRPWRVRLAGNDYSSPAIGSGRGELRASWNNVTGFGDELFAEYRGGVGLQDVRARWEWPVTPWDTRVSAHFRRTWSKVVEAPLDDYDISSQTATYGFRLSQPLYRTARSNLGAFLVGEYRSSETFLLGDPFSFVPGPDDGRVDLAVLRLGGDWTWRAPQQVLSARTVFSGGFPWLGATRNDAPDVPDAKFFAWLGQLQYARRFPKALDIQLVVRGDVQLANSPLYALEQFAIGGHATVRGYRENRLVRDNGVVGSVELRLPVPLPGWREWHPRFELAPFVDAGHSWNTDRGELGASTLLGVGIGGRLQLREGLDFQVYWGHDVKEVRNLGDDSLQDQGVHLGIVWELP